MWFVVRMNVGAEWFVSGWEKVTDPTWGTSGTALAGFVKGAISKTGGDHPSVQGWYGNFLQQFVLPNAGLFSFLVTWGELAVGLGILLGALSGIAAGFGVLMNLNYLLAGTVSVNTQYHSGNVRVVPVLLLAGLWSHWAGPLAPAHVGATLEARVALPAAGGRRSIVHRFSHCDISGHMQAAV